MGKVKDAKMAAEYDDMGIDTSVMSESSKKMIDAAIKYLQVVSDETEDDKNSSAASVLGIGVHVLVNVNTAFVRTIEEVEQQEGKNVGNDAGRQDRSNDQ